MVLVFLGDYGEFVCLTGMEAVVNMLAFDILLFGVGLWIVRFVVMLR